MTAPDHMPEMFENRLHEPGHPHMEPPAKPGRSSSSAKLRLPSETPNRISISVLTFINMRIF